MRTKTLLVALLAAATLTMGVANADAQGRRGGGGGGGGQSGGGARGGQPSGGARGAGPARPQNPGRGGPVVRGPVPHGAVPYRSYGYRYGYGGYPYYWPGVSFGIYGGYPYGSWNLGVGYGYPYGYYSGYYPYGYGYPYNPGYVTAVPGGVAYYGGLRIEGAPKDAQIFADGYYVGIVDQVDGAFQQANLSAGPHHIEIRVAGFPPTEFDVRIDPGQTVTYHADRR